MLFDDHLVASRYWYLQSTLNFVLCVFFSLSLDVKVLHSSPSHSIFEITFSFPCARLVDDSVIHEPGWEGAELFSKKKKPNVYFSSIVVPRSRSIAKVLETMHQLQNSKNAMCNISSTISSTSNAWFVIVCRFSMCSVFKQGSHLQFSICPADWIAICPLNLNQIILCMRNFVCSDVIQTLWFG